jgi:deoxyribodipyrimidine photo-lyase
VVGRKKDGFISWRDGLTGKGFIDAAMTELKLTGWLSNRMRQNAASYLVHDLDVDWRMGARWFETHLIDYDPCSNWGNWASVAGANFERRPHKFDIEQQANRYDPRGEYVRYWQNPAFLTE